MKINITLISFIVFLFSCQKEIEVTEPRSFEEEAIAYIKQSLPVDEIGSLDLKNFTTLVTSDKEAIGIKFFLKAERRRFLLVSKDENVFKASWVSWSTDNNANSIVVEQVENREERKVIFQEGRQIQLYKNGALIKTTYTETISRSVTPLPNVVVYAYIGGKETQLISYGWLGGGTTNLFKYLPIVPPDEIDYGQPLDDGNIEEVVELEPSSNSEVVNLEKLLNCLMNLAKDSNNIYKITLYSDIPANGLPELALAPDEDDLSNFNPGHTFIRLSIMQNGTNYEQYFGFYPKTSLKGSSSIPTASVIKNDRDHEYNASITRTIDVSTFYQTVSKAIQWSIKDYDLDDYNCTDYAVGLFNTNNPNPLIIDEKIILPFYMNQDATTPQGLYKTLLKKSNNPAVSVSVKGAQVGTGLGICDKQ
ncbi:hypothetical protein ACTJIJ_10070 [Niabella sp. 22666]|uniref:hypothetical protein n=1 Tax=Niabella sp. 22666 TaxID=3453954 RepID=UPI003F851AC1